MTRQKVFKAGITLFLAAALRPGLPSAFAQQKRPEASKSAETLPDFDIRTTGPSRTASLMAEGANFAQKLAATVDAAGNPVHYSLSADGRPRMISAAAGLTDSSGETPESIARAFLASSGGLSPFAPADVASMRLSQRSAAGALQVLYFQQYVAGLPVYGAAAKTAIDAEGRLRVVSYANPAPGVRLDDTTPALSAAQAARLALESLRVEAPAPLERLPSADGRTLFAHPGGPRYLPVAAELTAFPLGAGQARLAWRVFADAGAGSYEILLAADDGKLLLRQNLMAELASARVFPDTPLHDSEVREFPDAWLPSDAVATTGNNVDAYTDINADDLPDRFPLPGVQNGRAVSLTRAFDFPTGTGQDAGPAFAAAAITNAFYYGNFAHDFFYDLGFREREGNFQTDNFGRGGRGGDAIRMEAQDGALRNNANYTRRPDGMASRIQLGLWTSGGKTRDFAYDATAIVHEYAHGVSTRLIGGPDNISCLSTLQADALSEGWSDYFGASAFDYPVFGDYIAGDAVNGVRRAAIDKNARTFADLGDLLFQEHLDGEIWAATLWEIRTAIGVEKADALIAQGLFLTPCSPTFVDARDAILAADDGTNRATLWTVFAARGLGFGAAADNAGAAGRTIFNANYDLPPDLAPGNRSPRVTSVPPLPAMYGAPYAYQVRAVDLDGDAVAYELVSGPPGVEVDPATGRMTWSSPTFTSHRIQVAASDDRGGRTIHGFELRVDAQVDLGRPIQISGGTGSLGYAYLSVPSGVEILQVKIRGGGGEADLYLFTPDLTQLSSPLLGVNETLSVLQPQPGDWVIAITGALAYDDVVLSAEALTPAEIRVPGAATGLSDAQSGESFFKVVIPEGPPHVRITLAGRGDPDLLLAKDRIPLCGNPFGAKPCDVDLSAEGIGGFETLTLDSPPPGDYYLTVYGFQAYRDATLRVSYSASSVEIGGVVDAAAYQPNITVGGIVSVFGAGLAGITETASSFPLPGEIGGVRVSIEGVEAPLFFVSPTQINFQFPYQSLPSGTPLGAATMIIDRNGELSEPLDIPFDISAPRVFVDPSTLLPIATHLDGSLVTQENPAGAGEAVTVYLNGIGLVNDAPPDGEPAVADPLSRTLFDARASLGGHDVEVLFAGLTPGLVGLGQVNLLLPDDLPEGDALPLVLTFDTGFSTYESLPVDLPVGP